MEPQPTITKALPAHAAIYDLETGIILAGSESAAERMLEEIVAGRVEKAG